MSRRNRISWRLATACVVLPWALGACSAQQAISILPGVVNNPSNQSLRAAILSFGQDEICKEMLKRNVPLRLRDGDPIVGRFYPRTCTANELENGHLFLSFSGQGIAWTNVTGRLGFEAAASGEFKQDLRLDGSTMYVYFRQDSVTSQEFDAGLIEKPHPGIGLVGGDPQTYADSFGAQILAHEMARGFTVIRESDGQALFAQGVLAPGQKPPMPFGGDSDRFLLANDRSEVHQNQRDFIGPLEIPDDDMALYITVAVDGAPAVDVLVVPRSTGEPWLQSYSTQLEVTPPPAPPQFVEAVYAGGTWRRAVPLPKGMYYLVLDNTTTAGPTAPTSHAFDDRAAAVSYAIELDDAP